MSGSSLAAAAPPFSPSCRSLKAQWKGSGQAFIRHSLGFVANILRVTNWLANPAAPSTEELGFTTRARTNALKSTLALPLQRECFLSCCQPIAARAAWPNARFCRPLRLGPDHNQRASVHVGETVFVHQGSDPSEYFSPPQAVFRGGTRGNQSSAAAVVEVP